MIPAAVAIITALAFLLIYVVGQATGNFDDSTTPSGFAPSGILNEKPGSYGVGALAKAIAYAEGFGVSSAIPTLAHNPGDLKIPNWSGGTLGAGISVFGSDDEGWARLYHQLNLILGGHSKVYQTGMTISEMAQKWTATNPDDWANNVANNLTQSGSYAATPDTTLFEIIVPEMQLA